MEHPGQEFYDVLIDFGICARQDEFDVPENERDPLEPMPASFGMRNSATPGR